MKDSLQQDRKNAPPLRACFLFTSPQPRGGWSWPLALQGEEQVRPTSVPERGVLDCAGKDSAYVLTDLYAFWFLTQFKMSKCCHGKIMQKPSLVKCILCVYVCVCIIIHQTLHHHPPSQDGDPQPSSSPPPCCLPLCHHGLFHFHRVKLHFSHCFIIF